MTVKNKYLVPLIVDLFDHLQSSKIMSKLDLCKGYYQVRIKAEDEPKMAITTSTDGSLAALLTDLLCKDKTWTWTPEYQATFKTLKDAVMKEVVLTLPNFDKSFEMHTKASDLAFGGVLMQDDHLITYENHMFSDIEKWWPTHEKEILEVVYCL
nr:uncharacterized protein LOC113699736 [Coffea arabica]